MSIDQSREQVIGGEPLLQGTFRVPRGVYEGMVSQAQVQMHATSADVPREPVRGVLQGDQKSGVHFLGTEVMPVLDEDQPLPKLIGTLAIGYPDRGTGTGIVEWSSKLVVLEPFRLPIGKSRKLLSRLGLASMPAKDEIGVKAISIPTPVRHS